MRTTIKESAERLNQSTRGQSAMEALAIFCKDHVAGLDTRNKNAVARLLAEYMNGRTSSVIDAINNCLYDPEEDAPIPHFDSDGKRTKP